MVYYECCNDNFVATVKSQHQIHNVFTTLTLRRQIHIVVPDLPQNYATLLPQRQIDNVFSTSRY